MSVEGFSQEVLWGLIIPHVARPRPEPLSNPPNIALRQGDLCSVMRTSKLFHSICVPILYQHPITDRLDLLLRYKDTPSKRALLNHTRTLSIEYRQEIQDPAYDVLLAAGGSNWAQCGCIGKEKKALMMKQCEEEIIQLRLSLAFAPDDPLMVRKAFPRLETVAVASIRGISRGRWRTYYQKRVDSQDIDRIWFDQECNNFFSRFLEHLPSLKALCIREPSGPFSFHSDPPGGDIFPVTYARTLHIPADVSEVCLPTGHHIIWSSDSPSSFPWQRLSRAIALRLEDEKRILKSQENGQSRAKSDHVDLTIYASTATYGSETVSTEHLKLIYDYTGDTSRPVTFPSRKMDREEQTNLTMALAIGAQEAFRQSSKMKDVVKWYPSADMPICRACGSGPPPDQ